MTRLEKIKIFAAMGQHLRQVVQEGNKNTNEDYFLTQLQSLVQQSESYNGWHTPEQVAFALQEWGKQLTEENLTTWLEKYTECSHSKTVGLILAGNIPLVGFHDFLCVIMSGHRALVKLSSNDQKLLPCLADYLTTLAPELQDKIVFTQGKLEHFDAVIATGSNNTARYFEYYFRNKPSILRKNRNSVAILTGNETAQQLTALGEDIFRYFGLGCRNVSKIFVPRGYNFEAFFQAMYSYNEVIQEKKYANNYDYNKAVFLMSNFSILDNGFLTLKEDTSYSSPISSVFYEFYDDIETLKQRLTSDSELLQCIVAGEGIAGSIPFGTTQKPKLTDYADGIDTLSFLQIL